MSLFDWGKRIYFTDRPYLNAVRAGAVGVSKSWTLGALFATQSPGLGAAVATAGTSSAVIKAAVAGKRAGDTMDRKASRQQREQRGDSRDYNDLLSTWKRQASALAEHEMESLDDDAKEQYAQVLVDRADGYFDLPGEPTPAQCLADGLAEEFSHDKGGQDRLMAARDTAARLAQHRVAVAQEVEPPPVAEAERTLEAEAIVDSRESVEPDEVVRQTPYRTEAEQPTSLSILEHGPAEHFDPSSPPGLRGARAIQSEVHDSSLRGPDHDVPQEHGSGVPEQRAAREPDRSRNANYEGGQSAESGARASTARATAEGEGAGGHAAVGGDADASSGTLRATRESASTAADTVERALKTPKEESETKEKGPDK